MGARRYGISLRVFHSIAHGWAQRTSDPCNDAMGDYLDMLIKEEKCKEKRIRDEKKIEKLKKEKRTYEDEIRTNEEIVIRNTRI